MEIFGYHPDLKKWTEIGNSGMFRPEMLLPMGLPKVCVCVCVLIHHAIRVGTPCGRAGWVGTAKAKLPSRFLLLW